MNQLSDDQLRENLQELGFTPGPVTPTTRTVLQRKLRRLSTGRITSSYHVLCLCTDIYDVSFPSDKETNGHGVESVDSAGDLTDKMGGHNGSKRQSISMKNNGHPCYSADSALIYTVYLLVLSLPAWSLTSV